MEQPSAPASPPPKRPVGSFPQDHYSPGKLYTQFRIADGKSPLAWRKTKVFQADASPGSANGGDVSSPSPARETVSRRLDAGGPGADGERTPVRPVQPSYDRLFRANVPASRLLQRLQANKSLPPLMRKLERAYVQRRLLELVQPREPRTESEMDELRAAAMASRELPADHELPLLEKRFAKAIAARAAAYEPGRDVKSVSKSAKASGSGKGGGREGTPGKRKRYLGDEDGADDPSAAPICGGVSKTSGRALIIPPRFRQALPEKPAKRTPGGSRSGSQHAGGAHGENGAGVVSARKALKAAAAGPRIKINGHKGGKDDTLFSPGGSPFSPGGGHLRDRHAVRLGPLFQAALPAELPAQPMANGCLGQQAGEMVADRDDELLWTPPEWSLPEPAGAGAGGAGACTPNRTRASRQPALPTAGSGNDRVGGADGRPAASPDVLSMAAVDAYLAQMGQHPSQWSQAAAAPPALPLAASPLHVKSSTQLAVGGRGASATGPAAAGTPAPSLASVAAEASAGPADSDCVTIGGLSQERCLHALMQHGYDSRAAAMALASEEHVVVTWNKPEVRKFNVSLKSHGKLMDDDFFEANLRVVQRDVKTKSIGQVVHYFYLKANASRLSLLAAAQAAHTSGQTSSQQARLERTASPGPPQGRSISPAPSSAAPSVQGSAPSE